jgi:hypothetical protein
VLSCYDGVAGCDWIAIPLAPYLYAVERPEDVPLFADAKMVAFLRDRYRPEMFEGFHSGFAQRRNTRSVIKTKALRRSYVADLGISTPKQMAKKLVQFRASHPGLRPSRFIIPQVPGNIARSKTLHRVVG